MKSMKLLTTLAAAAAVLVTAPFAHAQVPAPAGAETEPAPPGAVPEPVPEAPAAGSDPAASEALPVADLPPPPEPAVEEEEPPSVEFEPGEGLHVRSADGNFELAIRARAMLLLTTEVPEVQDGAAPSNRDPEVDFEVRRARFTVQGAVFDRNLRYRLQLAVSPSDMVWTGGITGHATRTPLLDWYVESRHLRELNVRVGQFVTNIGRERTISSSSFQLVDRSLMNGEFNLDRDLAVELRSTNFLGLQALRYYAGIGNGEGRDSLLSADTAFLYYVRLETTPLGSFDDYVQSDLDRNADPRLAAGASFAFLDRGHNSRGILGSAPADGGTTDQYLANADVVLMWMGLSLHAEATLRHGVRHGGGAVDAMGNPIPIEIPRDGLGWFAQAGYLLPEVPVEVAARYGELRPVTAWGPTALTERHELGVGLNWFLHEHALKLQADFFELWEYTSRGEQREERVRVMFQASL